jgi:hypothetical protein
MSNQPQIHQSLIGTWRRRRFVAVVTLLVFVAALIQAIFTQPAQRAEVILLVNNVQATGELAGRLPSGLNPKSYSDLVDSLTVKGALHEQLAKDGLWSESGGPPPLKIFLTGLTVSSVVVDQTTRPVTYAPFIILHVKRETAEVASAVAEKWATVAIEIAQQRVHVGNEATRTTLAKQKASLHKKLSASMEALAVEEATWNLASIRTELDQLLVRQGQVERMRIDGENTAASAEERLAVTRELLKTEPVHVQLSKAPSDDVVFLTEQESGGATLESLQKKVMVSQVLNPAYTTIRLNKSTAEQDLAAANARLASLERQSATLDAHRAELQKELAHHDLKQKKMLLEVTDLTSIYTAISNFETFNDVAIELATAQGEDDNHTVGLNRLGAGLYTREYDIFGRTAKVLAVTVLAAILALIYAFLRCFIPLRWKSWEKGFANDLEEESTETGGNPGTQL